MPFDGSGNYIPAAAPNFPAVGGATIVSTYYNNVINDLAAALSLCITRDGQGKPSANIDWNGKNLSGVAGLTAVSFAFTTGGVTGDLNCGGNFTAATIATGAITCSTLTPSTPLSAAGGGTGLDNHLAGNGKLLIGNGAGFSLANLTAGANITITNAAGTITIAAAGGGGGGTTSFQLTVDNSGAGDASGFAFNGGAAKTLSYNSIGAKPIVPQIQTVASAATVTPTFANDLVTITALAASLTLANPTGTAQDGWGIVIRIKDNGTPRTITFGTQYRAIGLTLPTTTVANKTLYIGMVFNNADTKWDILSVAQEA